MTQILSIALWFLASMGAVDAETGCAASNPDVQTSCSVSPPPPPSTEAGGRSHRRPQSRRISNGF